MQTQGITFRGHVVIGGVLECRTGLHVGGNRDSLVVGGLDLPVLRDPATRLPVIPGSSLKGRLRALLEMLRGTAGGGDDVSDRAIALLFGARRGAGREAAGPTRLVVRDAFPLEAAHGAPGGARKPDESTIHWWRMLETDGLGTEVKAENAINRVTASAQPRQVERVLAGSRFGLEFVLNVFDAGGDADDAERHEERLVKDLLVALALLEDTYLGGHGSRGYGRVAILLHERPAVVSRRDYEAGRRKVHPSGALKELDAIDADPWIAHISERLGRAGAEGGA